jgi:hypothetical protein
MSVIEKIKPQRWVNDDELRWAADEVNRATVGHAAGGLRIDWSRLGPDERAELHGLVTKATTGGGFNVDERLGQRERVRLERLIEKGASADGVFERARSSAESRARMEVLLARVRRAARRPRWEEQGCVVLPKETAFDWLNRPDPILRVDHLGLLVFALSQLENGVALTPGGRIEGAGDDSALVIDLNYGLGASYVDPDGRLRWKEGLAHLGRNGWLAVERRGGELRVSRGSRALRAARGREAR